MGKAQSHHLKCIGLAGLVALVTALALSMAVARFAPWPEAERSLAGALTFPIWWVASVIYVLLGKKPARRLAVLMSLVVVFGLLIFGVD